MAVCYGLGLSRPFFHQALESLVPLLAFEVERVPALMILIELGAGQFRITCTHLCFQCCNGGFKLRHSTFRPAQRLHQLAPVRFLRNWFADPYTRRWLTIPPVLLGVLIRVLFQLHSCFQR